MAVHEVERDLFLVDLDLPGLEGFRQFLSAWVLRRGNRAVVVDPGPAAAIPALREALAALGVERLEAVLLTHIHIDHAGGAGLLVREQPDATVVCHRRGAPHLADPTALWDGSRKVLGRLAEAYGPIAPVPPGNLASPDELEAAGFRIQCLETPGHAPHHLAFRVGPWLFVGELAGVRAPGPATDCWRPATPPPFRHDVYRESLARARELGGELACLGHYGAVPDPDGILSAAGEQLDRWVEVVRAHRRLEGPAFEVAVFRDLLRTDPRFTSFSSLPGDVRERERYFFGNTLKGLRGWVERAG